MRIYSASSEETLRARRFLTEWTDDGLLSKEQCGHLEQDTVSDLRTTNIFLRFVLFFFTLIAVGAAVALFFVVFLPRSSSQQTTGIFLLIFAALSYATAEASVRGAHLYRHGIEEALGAGAVGFLCAGVGFTFFSSPSSMREIQFVIPMVGALASLWIWYRFNLWYAFAAAMIFIVFLPGSWTSSDAARHVWIALLYAAGLICIALVRAGHRFDYLEHAYSLAEAFLWLGIYLVLNLKLSALDLPRQLWSGATESSEFAPAFYWMTWVLIWCLPPVILTRGVRQKDRFILAVGAITAVLTLVTNKPYLGWQRHTWDPMLLGIALTGVAVFVRRWLDAGESGVRHGFTAARLSEKDKRAMAVGSSLLGLVTPQDITPAPQANKDFRFGGGGSGGGGADF